MGDTFIFIMGLICTGTVVAATFLSINELKDVNEPQLETMNMEEGTKKHLKLISTAIFIQTAYYWKIVIICWQIIITHLFVSIKLDI